MKEYYIFATALAGFIMMREIINGIIYRRLKKDIDNMKTLADLKRVNRSLRVTPERVKSRKKFLRLLDQSISKADDILADNVRSVDPKDFSSALFRYLEPNPEHRASDYPEMWYFNVARLGAWYSTRSDTFDKSAQKYGLQLKEWECHLDSVRMTVEYEAKIYPKHLAAIVEKSLASARLKLQKKEYHVISATLINSHLWRTKLIELEKINAFKKDFSKQLLSDINNISFKQILEINEHIFQDSYYRLRDLRSSPPKFRKLVSFNLERQINLPLNAENGKM